MDAATMDGKAVLEKYSISIGELVKAILGGLPAYDAVTGKRVIDQDSLVARPKYQTEEQAAKVVDLIDLSNAVRQTRRGEKPFRTYAPGGASGIDEIVRRNKTQLLMKDTKVYEFPAGQESPQEPWGVFPLRYDTFHREYSEPVMLGFHGEGESVQGLYQKLIGAMRFPVAFVEARFGSTTTGKTLDIRHVPLTPGQDWLGNLDPLLNRKQIARTISVFELLSRWAGASGESMGALSERLVRFLKHGTLHLFEPHEAGARVLYAPSTIGAAKIEIDCAVASLGGWASGLAEVETLSALSVDMVEVEAIEAEEYNASLKPVASNASGLEPEQVAPMGGGEAEDVQGKIEVMVPQSLFAGKTPQAVRNSLKEGGFDEHIIAYVLHKILKKNKTEVGRLLMAGKSKDGLTPADSTCLRHTNGLLETAAGNKIVIS
ncbi:hypothetical protein SAMN04488503_1458 [Humidesulfovibrio mexicanus]|uniref:Uncharacterized protein n=1 Tax=Humidesulfovibrio mexicanus TaxID=147047 RepID=A0A238ZEU8_9BACT|nr:hypothetical protein [Humidesulfovibrio mexicanus]SNR81491.1 hypothetical protein SAMN04488503_1458 [Humidesulfovibrio mexicanus]